MQVLYRRSIRCREVVSGWARVSHPNTVNAVRNLPAACCRRRWRSRVGARRYARNRMKKVVEQVAGSARLEPKRAVHKLTGLDRRDVAARRPARAPAYPAWMQPQSPGRSGRVLSGCPQPDCQRLLARTLVLMPCHCWRLSAEPGGQDSIGKPNVTGVCAAIAIRLVGGVRVARNSPRPAACSQDAAGRAPGSFCKVRRHR